MLEKYLENYIDDLYEKQNSGACIEQQGLYKKQDYYKLLKPVIELISNYKDYGIEELRKKLYEQSNIEEKAKKFIYHKEIAPGMVFSYGTLKFRETIIIGNKQEVSVDDNGNLVPNVEEMTEDTIFDLASTTKLFTSLSILKLVQDGLISLSDEVVKYEPRFKNLKGVTIFDLISFKTPLRTDGRVDGHSTIKESEDILFTMYVNKDFVYGTNPYTDMGALVLKYVIEKSSGINYYEYIEKNILNKLKMTDTHVVVPKFKLERLASTNAETIIYNDGKIEHLPIFEKGTVHDPKARDLGQKQGILSGHAGLFSTAKDMTNLARGIINGQVINDKYVEMLAKNRTGEKYIKDDKEKYVQYLGFLCYSKNPILADSELFHAMSGKAFASGGYTGTQLTVDPINQLYLFLGSNRTHNRVSRIDSKQRENVKWNNYGKGTVVLDDGSVKTTSYKFAWDRDEAIIHPALKLAIQYKLLEDIYSYDKEDVQEEVKKI